MILKNVLAYFDDRLTPVDAVLENGIVTDLQPAEEGTPAEGLLLPPLADIHTHGCLNIDFTEADGEQYARMAEYYRSCGVGLHLPTIISSPREAYPGILERLHGQKVRLEGPFFGAGKKGAHDASCLTLPDRAWLEELGLEHLAMVDIDPALPGALDMIEWLEGRGIKTSVAHTEATYEQAMAAFDRGCRHVTHLFNAMNGLHHRESGVLGAAFDRGDVIVELICDGYHVSPPVVRMAFALYKDRVCVISDSFKTMGIETEGCARLADGTIAGAVQGVQQTLGNLIRWGIPAEEAVRAVCRTPYLAMGLEAPQVAVGKAAHLVIV